MNDASTASVLSDEQQRLAAARTVRAGREYLKNFVLVFALIVLTLAVAIAIGRMGLDGTHL